jgi:hypothetical protein
VTIPADKCSSKPDCPCEFCTVTRYEPTEEDVLAEQFLSFLAGKAGSNQPS